MVEQMIQMGADFIEAQGMMAFVVVVLAVLMYRDQTARAQDSKRQSDNFAVESKQQGEMLAILREEVANNGALINKVDQLKTDLITEAQSISDAATMPLIASLDAYAKDVKQTGTEIMNTVQPLDEILRDIRNELQELRASVDTHMNTFKDEVATKTAEIEVRLLQVEKRATQETPAIPTTLEPIPKKKPTTPGVPVTPKPKAEPKEGKS